jgi:predicted component of type VI protein secretion system
LPESGAMARFVEFTRFIVGQALAFDVQVFLQAAEVPYCRLSDEGFDAPRLGWMGWLKTEEFQMDAGDAVFTWVN